MCAGAATTFGFASVVVIGRAHVVVVTEVLVRVVVCSSAQRVRKLIPSHGVAPAPREPVIGQAVQVAVVVPRPAPGGTGRLLMYMLRFPTPLARVYCSNLLLTILDSVVSIFLQSFSIDGLL